MGKLVIEKWQCDRCGEVFDSQPRGVTKYCVVVSVDYGDAGGKVINWREMCNKCNAKMSSLVDTLLPKKPTPEPPHA